MTLDLRYVDKRGFVMKHLVSLAHVTSISIGSLKETIYSMLAQLSLNPYRVREQGYYGTSDIRGHINEFMSLIIADCSSTHYVDWFAHQLQLILVKVVHTHVHVSRLIGLVNLT